MAQRAKAREALVVEVQPNGVGGDAGDESPMKGIPLFEGSGGDEIVGISVYRSEPVEEGTLPGILPPDADEAMIQRRWGGGVYRISAKGRDGRIKASRTITLGGDPKFESSEARRRYRIKIGELEDEPSPAREAPAKPAAPPGFGLAEVMALITTTHQQQMEVMRMQAAQAAHEAEDRAQRARSDAEDREKRLRREADDSRERDRAFHATMLAAARSEQSARQQLDPTQLVSLMMGALKLGRDLSSSGNEAAGASDPLTALVTSLPGIIQHGTRLVEQHHQLAPGAQPAAPRQPKLTMTGPIADKFSAEVRGLMARGYTREQAEQLGEQAVSHAIDAFLKVVPPTPEHAQMAADAAAAAAVTSPPSAAPADAAPAPTPNETPRRRRATTRR